MGGYSGTSDLDLIWKFGWGGILNFRIFISIGATACIFKYYALFYDCLGYYIYLLLFPIIFTLLLIFD